MKISLQGILSDPVAPLIGAVQGLLLYYLTDTSQFSPTPLRNAVLFFVLATPATYLLAGGAGWRPRVAAFSVILGLIPAILTYWLCDYLGPDSFGRIYPPPGSMFAVTFLWFVGTALAAEPNGHRFWAVPYRALFNQLWRIILTLLIAVFFVAVTWVVFFLWAVLFKLINIDLFERIIRDPVFTFTARGALYAAAVALLRDIPAATEAPRRFALATFRLLAPVLAFFAILFLAALALTGFGPLWQTGRASVILLSVAVFFIMFVNGYVGDGSSRTDPPRPIKELLRGMMILLPVYPVLALYALGIRIADYSLTPSRFVGAIYILIALLVSVGYAMTRLRRTGDWRSDVAAINKAAILLLAVLLPLSYVPGLDPISLSARAQLARIQDNATDVDALDLGYLKFDLRNPGQKAFAKLEKAQVRTDDPVIGKLLKDVADIKNYQEWRQRRAGVRLPMKADAITLDMITSLETYPAGAPVPPGLADKLKATSKTRQAILECAKRPSDSPGCVLLMLDFNHDDRTDAGLWNGYSRIEIFIRTPAGDQWVSAGWLDATGRIDAQSLRDALTRDEVEVVPPMKDNLKIGDTRFE
jgi:hypothetical protein